MSVKNLLIIGLLLLVPTSSKASRLARKAGIHLKERAKEKASWGIMSRLKSGARSMPIAGKLMDFVDGGIEEKVDRIDRRQKSASERIIDVKHTVEDLHFFKERSFDNGRFVAEGLRKGNSKNFLLALLEGSLGLPINPAEYLPRIPATDKLRRKLDLDLSLEKRTLAETNYLLSGTRSFIIQSGIMQRNPKEFEKQYKEAQAYEEELLKGLENKENTRIMVYRKDIERFEREIKGLEEAKTKKGLTVSDVMQIELVLIAKRKEIRELDKEITSALREQTKLSPESKAEMAYYQAQKDVQDLDDYMKNDRLRMRQKHSHLWKIWKK